MLKEMWLKLDAYTFSAKDRVERSINVRNEWGGYSRRLGIPVFTGWQDHTRKVDGETRVLVSDKNWLNKAGVNNQEFWVERALLSGGEAAYFMIKAVDPNAVPRKVEWLDDSRVLCGRIERHGDQVFIFPAREVPL
jgi:hypothetical protein